MPTLAGPQDADSIDRSLLLRLNALRSSNVALNPQSDCGENDASKNEVGANDLAERFAKLGNKSLGSSRPAPDNAGAFANIVPGWKEESSVYNAEDDRSLQELLNEIGPPSDWDVTQGKMDRATKLLKQAREALNRSAASNENSVTKEDTRIDEFAERKEPSSSELRISEEQDANEYIQQILGEIELESESNRSVPDNQTFHELNDQPTADDENSPDLAAGKLVNTHDPTVPALDYIAVFNLPTAPTHSPMELRSDDVKLPSPPKSTPGPSLQRYLDEEIDSWCIICNNDAEIRCLGCDNDLYCNSCWFEGHKSPNAGYEERTHKAVTFVKTSPKQKKEIEAS